MSDDEGSDNDLLDVLDENFIDGDFDDFVDTDDEAEQGPPDDEDDDDEQDDDLAGETGEEERIRLKAERAIGRDTRDVRASRKIIIVAPEERVTSNVLQRAEAARLISIRAKQISEYPTSYLVEPRKRGAPLHDPKAIATRELYERRMPLRWRRRVGQTANGDLLVEEWNPREMTLPAL